MKINEMNADDYLEFIRKLPIVSDECPVLKTLELCSGRWRLHVLYQLYKQSSFRFGELRRALPGITSTMLTAVLRDLIDDKMVHRKQFIEIPPHVEYSLTERGTSLMAVLDALCVWGEEHRDWVPDSNP